jgi:hypothetical protein
MSILTRLALIMIALTFGVTPGFGQDSKPKTDTSAEAPPAPAVEYDPHAWKEFSDERGMFSIMFPGVPVEAENSSGEIVGRKFILITSADYFLGYQDFPPTIPELEKDAGLRKQFFDRARDQLLSASKAKVLIETDVALDGHPGRFMKLNLANGGILRQYMYAVGKRAYQMFVITPKELPAADRGQFDETRATKFLTSFRLADLKNKNGTKP